MPKIFPTPGVDSVLYRQLTDEVFTSPGPLYDLLTDSATPEKRGARERALALERDLRLARQARFEGRRVVAQDARMVRVLGRLRRARAEIAARDDEGW